MNIDIIFEILRAIRKEKSRQNKSLKCKVLGFTIDPEALVLIKGYEGLKELQASCHLNKEFNLKICFTMPEGTIISDIILGD